MGPLLSVIPEVLKNPIKSSHHCHFHFSEVILSSFLPHVFIFFLQNNYKSSTCIKTHSPPFSICYASQEVQRVHQKVLLLLTSCWVQLKWSINPLTRFLKRRKEKVRFRYFSPTLPISIIVGWQKSSARDHSFCQTTFSTQFSFPNWPPFLLIPPQVLVTTQRPRYCTISTEIVTISLVNFPQITHLEYAICFLQVL